MRIENYNSDIELTVKFTFGGQDQPIPTHDFCLRFRTTGGNTFFDCRREKGVYYNCSANEAGTRLTCHLDNHGLAPGDLRCEFYDYIPNSHFTDGNRLAVMPSEMSLALEPGGGSGTNVDAEFAIELASFLSGIIVDDLESGGRDKALSAEQGKKLGEALSGTEVLSCETVAGKSIRRYPTDELGRVIDSSPMQIQVYRDLTPGEKLTVSYTGEDASSAAQAAGWYNTGVVDEMDVSTFQAVDGLNIYTKNAAGNTYEVTVPSNFTTLVLCMWTGHVSAEVSRRRVGVAIDDIKRELAMLGEALSTTKLLVSRAGDIVTAVCNDGKGHELVYKFETTYPGSNKGYGLNYVGYRPAGSSGTTTMLQTQGGSDMIGPLGVNNVWCGGAHRIELADKSLVRSIGNITKHIYANGAEVNDGDSITCDELTVVVSQEVYAPNATKTGLVLLCQETVTWKVHADVVGVSVVHDFTNSECAGRVITTYYGMQTYGLGNVGDLQTMTLRGRFPVLQTISNSSSSYFTKADFPHFNCFVQYRPSDGWCVSAKINPEIGIGDHSYVGDTDNIFVTGPSKLYHHLIVNKTITAGMKYVWAGEYRFVHIDTEGAIYLIN